MIVRYTNMKFIHYISISDIVKRFKRLESAGIPICKKELRYTLKENGYTYEDYLNANK